MAVCLKFSLFAINAQHISTENYGLNRKVARIKIHLSVVEKYFFSQIQTSIYTEGADLEGDHKIVMFSTLHLLFIVTMSTACVRCAARLGRALAGIYLARPDWLLAMGCPRVTSPLTGTRS